MYEPNRRDRTEEFHARIASAVAGTPYRLHRTGTGFELTADVPGPDRQTHTYRVELRPQELAFTMTDVVRTSARESGLFGAGRERSVSVGRSVYIAKSRALDGSGRWETFRSADGHRLIRGAAGELGWHELRPASAKAAKIAGLLGGAVALAVLIALAAVFLARG
ncbi:hypothetical protein ACWCV9_15945 [Streptomyces sp. NPDC001606]